MSNLFCTFAEKFEKDMERNEIKARVREIVNKPARELTAEDKSFLTEAAAELEIESVTKAGCKKCWHEVAMRIAIALNNNQPADEDNKRAYVLREGVDLLFGGIRINAATLTDELARKIIERGFDKKYFAVCE